MKNRVNWSNLPADPAGMSFADCQKAYRMLWNSVQEQKRMRRASDSVAKARSEQARESKTEVKGLRRNLLQITKQQKAKDELKACGSWSGAATGITVLTWQAFHEYGAPFPQFMVDSEWFFGSVCWMMTMLFGWAAKAFHGAD